MGEIPFVDGEDTLCFDGFPKTVKDAAVEVSGLVVKAGHDRICDARRRLELDLELTGSFVDGQPGKTNRGVGLTWWMHSSTHSETTDRTARQM